MDPFRPLSEPCSSRTDFWASPFLAHPTLRPCPTLSLPSLALEAALDCRPWPSALSPLSLLSSGSGPLSSSPNGSLLACCHLRPTTVFPFHPCTSHCPLPRNAPFWSPVSELFPLLGASKLLHTHTPAHAHPPFSLFLMRGRGGGSVQGARGEGQRLNFESPWSLQ